MSENFSKDDLALFIGKKESRLYRKLSKYDSRFFGFNWIALFFPVQWMAYRKMYVELVLYMLIAVLTAMGFSRIAPEGFFLQGRIIYDLFRILMLFLANILYMQKFKRAVNKTVAMNRGDRVNYFRKKGGTSELSLAVLIIFEIMLFVAMMGL
jgi:hypothetical protein